MTNDPHRRALQRLEQLERDGGEPTAYGGPDPVDPALMADGSPGWQMVASIALPGVSALRRRPVLALTLLLLGVFAPLALLVWVYNNRADLVGFALRQEFLLAVVAVCLAMVLVRLAAVFEIASYYRRRPGIALRTFLATVLVMGMGVPVLWAGWQANAARSVVADVFAGGSSDPIYTDAGLTVDPSAVQNILLLGSDAGPGRWGARTDTMIIVSIHEYSGRTALVSIPRNLTRLQFPPGTAMHDEYPGGFDDHQSLTNAIFTAVESNSTLLEAYDRDGLQPHALALAEGIGYSLGIEIDDFALVNMQGFADMIDAVGGVTINIETALPTPGDIEGVPATLGPGEVDMNGNYALAFVRSRSADSDYQRMGRQRQLLAALGSQVSATDAAGGFNEITDVLGETMRTSLSANEFSDLLTKLGDSASIGESIGLAPPIVQPGSPDYDEIKSIMNAVINYVLTGEPSGYAS